MQKAKLLVVGSGSIGEQISQIALSIIIPSEPAIPHLGVEHLLCQTNGW